MKIKLPGGIEIELRKETDEERKERVERRFREWWDKGTKKYAEDRK
jgi:hypothetical protein